MSTVTVRRVLRRATRSNNTLDTEVIKRVALQDAEQMLTQIALEEQRIAAITQTIANDRDKLEELLKLAGVNGVEANGYKAEFFTPWSRQTKTVDPQTLFNKVKDRENYFSMVKVQITELANFFSAKEIENMAVIAPPVKLPTVLKITANKVRK